MENEVMDVVVVEGTKACSTRYTAGKVLICGVMVTGVVFIITKMIKLSKAKKSAKNEQVNVEEA